MTDSLSVEVGFEISIQLVGSRFFELYPRDSKAQNSGFHKQNVSDTRFDSQTFPRFPILGDQGSVSQVGRRGTMEVFKNRRKLSTH